jgi:23S rRNA pseudouridine1911/1915/1917 synthase
MPIRLDKLVAEQFGLSRRAAQDAVRNGRIDVAGDRCDEPGREIEPGTTVEFFPNRPKARTVASRLRVLHEDRHVLIVDKPAGLLTLPTHARERETLLDRAGRYLSIRHGGQRPFVGVVHRLDKNTSGALALARSPEAVRAFQALFKAHDIVATLLACWLETGRTHQIRIHLAEIGHPVVGDPVYRPRNQPRTKARFARQALHAQTLGFVHPLTRQHVYVEAPPPPDLDGLINDLRNRYGVLP